MKPFRLLSIFCLLCITQVNAQKDMPNAEDEFNRAEAIFLEISEAERAQSPIAKEGYMEALPVFLKLYQQDTSNMNLAFKIGLIYHSSRKNRAKAIPYFKKAATSTSDNYKGSSFKEKKAPLITYKYLGDAYHLNYQFELAIREYEKYLVLLNEHKGGNQDIIDETNRKIEMCRTGQILLVHPVNVKTQNLGASVNSSFPDYSPVLSADQKILLFTSRRPRPNDTIKDEVGNYFEDIYISNKTATDWSPARNIGAPINTGQHEATVGLSPDGKMILIYKDDDGDGNIYSTSLNGETWSTPVKLNDNVNTKYWEPSGFISADGSTLYFISNRPGGYGGRDIYVSHRNEDGDWGKATNLGPDVNTAYDEDAPFIHPDGVTLFFSSNGNGTMGGFDIFMTYLGDDGKWAKPTNVGYPLNTPDDDVFYVVSPDGRTSYFSSFRSDGVGEKDNYTATFLDAKQTPITVVQGNVACLEESNKNITITVTDNATEKVVGVYRPNSKTGQFLFILTPGRNYNITYSAAGHLFHSENMDIPKQSQYFELKEEIALCPIAVGSKITLNNIFFDFDKATLRPLSNVEIKNLIKIMQDNPNIKVEISGHTDNKGDDNYNLRLSVDRARAVVEQLTINGIDGTRMKARGFGETEPVTPNTNKDGSDNPEGRQLNRRVEFKITEVK
ncbi:MAG: OmpA family protein [Flavobacteriales bacterium]